jgi:hypothetical protein
LGDAVMLSVGFDGVHGCDYQPRFFACQQPRFCSAPSAVTTIRA